MKLLDHLAAVAVWWLTLAAIATGAWVLVATRHKARNPHPEVNWRPYLPPVPRPTTPPLSQTLPDPSWFDGIPADCLSDDAIHSLFDSIVDGEFR